MDVESRGPEGSRVFLRESFTFALEKKKQYVLWKGNQAAIQEVP